MNAKYLNKLILHVIGFVAGFWNSFFSAAPLNENVDSRQLFSLLPLTPFSISVSIIIQTRRERRSAYGTMNDVYASEYLCLFIIFMVRMIFMPVKNPNNSPCIDFFLTDTIKSFQETQVIETGLSDFHKLVVTVLQTIFPK